MVDNLKNVKLMVLPQVNSSGNQTQQYQLALLHSFERAKVPKISVAYQSGQNQGNFMTFKGHHEIPETKLHTRDTGSQRNFSVGPSLLRESTRTNGVVIA